MYVDQSSIPDAEEGLFAKVDVEESTVISFYNGVRYDVKDTTIEMENCPYKISLNEDIDLDIPEDMISTDKYKATLAHKVSIQPDSVFQWLYISKKRRLLSNNFVTSM